MSACHTEDLGSIPGGGVFSARIPIVSGPACPSGLSCAVDGLARHVATTSVASSMSGWPQNGNGGSLNIAKHYGISSEFQSCGASLHTRSGDALLPHGKGISSMILSRSGVSPQTPAHVYPLSTRQVVPRLPLSDTSGIPAEGHLHNSRSCGAS